MIMVLRLRRRDAFAEARMAGWSEAYLDHLVPRRPWPPEASRKRANKASWSGMYDSDDDGSWDKTYTLVERTTGTDEETSTNGATNGNHVQVTGLHGTIKLDKTMAVVLAAEGVEVETVTGHPGLVVVRVVQVASAHGLLALSANNAGDTRDLVSALLAAIVAGEGVLGGHDVGNSKPSNSCRDLGLSRPDDERKEEERSDGRRRKEGEPGKGGKNDRLLL